MDRGFGDASLRPYLPLQLQIAGKVVDTSGLYDVCLFKSRGFFEVKPNFIE
jgi:hypothetical protein